MAAGVIAFIAAAAMLFITWTPVTDWVTNVITPISGELGLFMKAAYFLFMLTVAFIAPIKLSIADETGA